MCVADPAPLAAIDNLLRTPLLEDVSWGNFYMAKKS